MSKRAVNQQQQDPEIKNKSQGYTDGSAWSDQEKKLMLRCLKLAESAQKKGEIPIGALVVDDTGKILAQSGNIREQKQTVLGHCELVALHNASKKKASWRLSNCTLFVSLEPCHMCAAAIMQARIKKVVFAASDPKAGAFGSKVNLSQSPEMHHHIEVRPGLMAAESSQLIKTFFRRRRAEKKLARKTQPV